MTRVPSAVVLGALCAVLAVGFAVYAWYHPSQYTYVERNDAAFTKIAVYPGAQTGRESTSPIYASSSALSRVLGYRTTRSYTLQIGIPSEAIVDYYLYELQHCRLLGQSDTEAHFTCNDADVDIHVEAGDRYEVTVDSR